MSSTTVFQPPTRAPEAPRPSGREHPALPTPLRRILLACGVLSSALYVGAEVYAWSQYPGYSPMSQAFSELLAEGAPTRSFMVAVAGLPYNLLVAALAISVWSTPGGARVARFTGAMLLLYALFSFLGGTVFEMDVRGSEPTLRGSLHPLATAVMIVFMLLSIACGAFLHGMRFRVYSITTLITIVILAAIAFAYVPQLAANQPTPWLGAIERVNIYAWMLWVAVVAMSLWPATVRASRER